LVYSPYVLCRTIEVWQNLSVVHLPGQIRDLLEATYLDRHGQETGKMAGYFFKLEKERETLSRLARVGLSSAGSALSDKNPSTRHSDQPSCEVLLLKSYRPEPEENGVWIKLLDDSVHFLPKNTGSLSRKEWRRTAALIAMNTVTVPEYMAPKTVNRKVIEGLSGYVYLGKNNEDSPFRAALVQESLDLVSVDNSHCSDKYAIQYRSDYGFLAQKNNQKEESFDEGW